MATLRVLWTAILSSLLIQSAWTQQPAGTEMYVGYPGLSDACRAALATDVTCPPFISVVSVQKAILDSDEVQELCIDSCYTSLQKARSTIKTACTADTDIIVYDNVAYPATFIADNYLFTYEVSCKKDKAGHFCDPQFRDWANQSGILNSRQLCSDCWLGVLADQLNHPLGYDDGLARNFASLSSSCSATGYSFTSPTAYALNSTVATTPTVLPKPRCTGSSYTVEGGDDCNSIAKKLNVSTYNLIQENYLDLYCRSFVGKVNTTLCIPPRCNTYTWKASDTCEGVVSGFSGMTIPQFLAWNPNFSPLCRNGPFFHGYEVCVSPPGGYLNDTTGTATARVTGIVPAPTNAMDGSNRNCSQWYTIQEGDDCALVSMAHAISLTDFYFLNPEIDQECSNLELGETYCVRPVGSIATYPNYTVTGVLPITVPPATFPSVNTAIPTSTNNPGFIYTPPPLLPTAAGTIPGCYEYANPNEDLIRCRDFAGVNDVSPDQLFAWNPSLERNVSTCTLQLDHSYCVKQYKNSTARPTYSYSYCVLDLSVDIIEPGTAPNCNCFNYVEWGDDYTCQDFALDYEITVSQLLAWNSWLVRDCDAALMGNLNKTSTRAVCVGVGNAPSTTPTMTVSKTATSTTASMGPTQTGVVSGCRKFYTVQSGDTCPAIESKFGITAAQFYNWNPTIGTTCLNLWLGYAYCVEGPVSSPTAPSVSAPTQSGIAANCNKYHTVISGDSCAKIQATYGITFAEMYQWNPAIGPDCRTLEIGYAICVGVVS
ncbi:hypothetical protein BDV28DRAFT_132335 [Aspergillus coremiiformis]|uniref:LysM domain-containing protein n=1 Tax=Aspergillus coremiiformis TaxID=138285 RepID=A0A5N6ZAU0_9EURO|nr:hypothetical protein BDV28DRAFT_132335 [Aspergillus coremiiformis]